MMALSAPFENHHGNAGLPASKLVLDENRVRFAIQDAPLGLTTEATEVGHGETGAGGSGVANMDW